MATKKKALQAAAGAAGAGEATYVDDVFSTYLHTGNGLSQVIENGINLGDSNAGGSGYFDGTGDYLSLPSSSDLTLSGDFTIEFWAWKSADNADYDSVIGTSSGSLNYIELSNARGFLLKTDSVVSYSFDPRDGQWHHYAATRSGSTVRLFLDGTQVASMTNSTALDFSGGYICYTGNAYYFLGNISNLRIIKGTALYTSAFTPPTSELTAVSGTELLILQGDEPFVDNSSNAHTITQNGNVAAKSFGPFDADTAGEGGLVWIKARDNTTNHLLADTETGITKRLQSNLTSAQDDGAGIWVSSANADGFSLGAGSQVNGSSYNYASWTFRKAPGFFDVVTYTGNGVAGREIAHNLGSTPGVIIVKWLDTADDWYVYHRSLGATKHLRLNLTDAAYTQTNKFNDTEPTDSVFTVGNDGGVNRNGDSYVAYLFAHNDGDGEFGESGDQDIIKCGSFTTDGSGNADVDLGWEPQWLILKNATTGSNNEWRIVDNMRGFTVDSGSQVLAANASSAEFTSGTIDYINNGFKIDGLANSATFIYIAIRRGPMKTPESGTEVFALQNNPTATPAPAWKTDFPVDMALVGRTTTWDGYIGSRLTGETLMQTHSTAAETASSNMTFDYSNGFGETAFLSSVFMGYMFRRAPGFFDVVAYTGTSSARSLNHNLGVTPELIIVKARNQTYEWYVWTTGFSPSTALRLPSGYGSYGTIWGSTNPPVSDTTFNVGGDYYANSSSADYIAYLFASCPGVSKVGRYTGNGTSQTIDCGFSSGARFVLIKKLGGGDWHVWDTARGIVSGNDPFLELNTTNAENTSYDSVDPDSSGFIVNEDAGTAINTSGGTYIYLAIA